MNIKEFTVGMIGTNCYLAWSDDSKEAFLIDPADRDPNIVDEIKKNDLTLKYIILTHGHSDHIGGVEDIKKNFPEAKLVAGKDESELLVDPNINHSIMMLGRPVSLKADIEVSDGDVLTVGNEELQIIATPGHTRGGISIYCGNVVFAGDTLFRTSIGRTDLQGGDFQTLIDSIKQKLFVLPNDTRVLPGHMGPTSIGDEKQFNPYVQM